MVSAYIRWNTKLWAQTAASTCWWKAHLQRKKPLNFYLETLNFCIDKFWEAATSKNSYFSRLIMRYRDVSYVFFARDNSSTMFNRLYNLNVCTQKLSNVATEISGRSSEPVKDRNFIVLMFYHQITTEMWRGRNLMVWESITIKMGQQNSTWNSVSFRHNP